jgi:hypothetical protein
MSQTDNDQDYLVWLDNRFDLAAEKLKDLQAGSKALIERRKEDIERMREEMWSQFAPDTVMPQTTRRPSKRTTLTDEDYAS